MPPNSEPNFVQPHLSAEVEPLAIVMICLFGGLTLLGGVYSMQRWYKQCFQDDNEEGRERRYTFEDEEKLEETDSATVIQRLSL